MVKTGLSMALLATLVAAPPVFGGSPSVGEEAPELTPSAWLNHRGAISWKALEGRLLLVERWATT
jgi:hypothetical protein